MYIKNKKCIYPIRKKENERTKINTKNQTNKKNCETHFSYSYFKIQHVHVIYQINHEMDHGSDECHGVENGIKKQ